MLISRVYQTKAIYSQTCVQRPPLGLKKVAVVQKVAVIVFKKLGIMLAVADM
jgi:hypothetical protein